MGKKPALSLRKPPAPVDLSVAERFVRSTEAVVSVQTSERPDVRALERSDAPTSEPLGVWTSERSDVRTSEPPYAVIPHAVSRPVQGRPDVPVAERPDVQRAVSLVPPSAVPRGVLARKDGRELRRMTLYLPSELARRLAVYCAELDLEMSDVVTAAVRVHLGQ